METPAFIAACRRLRDLDLSQGNAVQLDLAITQAMPPRYAIPYQHEGRQTFVRSTGTAATNRRGQWHELVQHLHDLGYVDLPHFKAWHRRRAKKKVPLREHLSHVYAGIALYLAEEDYALYPQLTHFATEDFDLQTEWVETHLSIIVFRLAELTSFDGDLRPAKAYRIGDHSVYGRSIMFRLRVLFGGGMLDFQGRAYFERSLTGYLAVLAQSINFKVQDFADTIRKNQMPDVFWTMLLSWDYLFAAFREANRFAGDRNDPYLLLYDIGQRTPAPDRLTANLNARRQERLRRRLQRKLSGYRTHIDGNDNLLGQRLVQLGLWRAGFYEGAIDGDFGLMSHNALRNLLAQEWEADRPVIRRKKKLGRALVSADDANGNFWAADLRIIGKILEAYAPPSRAEAAWEENAIWEELSDKAIRPDWEEEVLKQEKEVAAMYGDQNENPLRRVYYGLRGLLRGAFRAIGRIVKWVVRKVGEIAGAVFSFFKAAVKRIREGIGLFFEGFRYFSHYLLGKPFITLGTVSEDGDAAILATRLSLDFDTANFVSYGATDEDLARHQTTLHRLGEGLAFFLNTFSDIIHLIASLTTPLGWVRLGVLIARIVREVLSGTTRQPVLA